MRAGTILGILLGALCSFPASGAVWYVDRDNTSGTADGRTWQTAFRTIQPAIDAAYLDGGGDVWVAEGVYDERRYAGFEYTEPEVPVYRESGALHLRDGVRLFGGFAGDETELSQRDLLAHETRIDGSSSRNGLPALHVIRTEGTTTINGMTITGGGPTFEGELANNGAGVYTTGEFTELDFVTVRDNHATGFGGGLYCDSKLVRLRQSTLLANSAQFGGGAYVADSGPLRIENCSILENDALELGGGIHARFPVYAEQCEFVANSASGGGGFSGAPGSDYSLGSFFAIGCIFKFNSALIHGGAIRSQGPSSVSIFIRTELLNCVIWRNSAQSGAPGVASFGAEVGQAGVRTAQLRVDFSTIVDNQTDASSIQVSVSGGQIRNSIVLEPEHPVSSKFAPPSLALTNLDKLNLTEGNLDFVDESSGDFRLGPDSPAIDNATGQFFFPPSGDILGFTRPSGAGLDVGAFEHQTGDPIPATHIVTLETSNPELGTTMPPPGQYQVRHGDPFPVTAIPFSGSAFYRWKERALGADNPMEFPINQSQLITAEFQPRHVLTIGVQGLGTTLVAPGTIHGYRSEPIRIAPVPGLSARFSRWWENGTRNSPPSGVHTYPNPYHYYPRFDATLVFQFTHDSRLVLESTSPASPAKAIVLFPGVSTQLEANETEGYEFLGWECDALESGFSPDRAIQFIPSGTVFARAIYRPLDGYPYVELACEGLGEIEPLDPATVYEDKGRVRLRIRANPSQSGWRFLRWVGNLPKGIDRTLDTIDAPLWEDATVTAVFEPSYPGLNVSLSVAGEGKVLPSEGSHSARRRTPTMTRAVPAPGHYFSGWRGLPQWQDRYDPVPVFTPYQPMSLAAEFRPETGHRNLNIDAIGNGQTDPPPGSHSAVSESDVTLSATPATGWEFDRWQGDVPLGVAPGSQSISINADHDRTIRAYFRKAIVNPSPVTLTLNSIGEGQTSPGAGLYYHLQGDTVRIHAVPTLGFVFDRWEGDLTEIEDFETTTLTFSMDYDRELSAVFVPEPPAPIFIQVAIETEGNGTTIPAAGEYTFEEGETISVRAEPELGWSFFRWDGSLAQGGSFLGPTIEVVLVDDVNFRAVFTENVIPPPDNPPGDDGDHVGCSAAFATRSASPLGDRVLLAITLLTLAITRRRTTTN